MRHGASLVIVALRHVLQNVLHGAAVWQRAGAVRARGLAVDCLLFALLTFMCMEKKNELLLNELLALDFGVLLGITGIGRRSRVRHGRIRVQCSLWLLLRLCSDQVIGLYLIHHLSLEGRERCRMSLIFTARISAEKSTARDAHVSEVTTAGCERTLIADALYD